MLRLDERIAGVSARLEAAGTTRWKILTSRKKIINNLFKFPGSSRNTNSTFRFLSEDDGHSI